MSESTGRAASNPVEQKLISTALEELNKRLHLQLLSSTESLEQDVASGGDVIHGLSQTPKTLPPRYFYDDRGSELFEQICALPEYYLTRTETAILQAYAPEVARITGPCELVELGSGSATKTRLLLDAYSGLGYPLRYLPIDVSGGMLESSALDLLTAYPALQVHGLVGTYELALKRLTPTRLPTRMICFLGSTLGNLNSQECETFFTQIFGALQPGEYFLLGVDLQKSQEQLEAAYNDRQGITAEFNLNILRHLNQRFAGDFDLSQFIHWAFYNQSQHQIEMHLKSLSPQTARLETLDLAIALEAGETILTEISRKFNLSQIQQDLQIKGLMPSRVWTDPNQWFGLILCQRQ
jgi:dimethylhistidine N-methyltransferase